MNENTSQSGTIQLLGMIAGLMVAPILTPAVVWATIAANLPIALVMVQLVAMALISKWLMHKLIRDHVPTDATGDDQPMINPWSSEPSNG